MSKVLSLLFILSFSFTFSQEEPQLPSMDVFGKVKFISINSQYMDSSNAIGQTVNSYYQDREFGSKSLEYDKRGYWKEYLEYKSNGKLHYGQLYTYDSLGYIMYSAFLDSNKELYSENVIFRNPKHQIETEEHWNMAGEDVTTYTYDENDTLIQQRTEWENGIIKNEVSFTYSDDYRKIEKIRKEEAGEMFAKSSIERDKKGRTILDHSQFPGWGLSEDGISHYVQKYKYKKGGKVVEHYVDHQNGKDFFQDKYVYDTRGNLLERTNFIEPNGICGTFTTTIEKYEYDMQNRCTFYSTQDSYNGHFNEYHYDEKGNFILGVSGELNSEGEYIDSTFYAYDVYDNLVSETHKGIEGVNKAKSFECVYQYDDHNNWIKRDEYREGKLYYTSVRSFEYFEEQE